MVASTVPNPATSMAIRSPGVSHIVLTMLPVEDELAGPQHLTALGEVIGQPGKGLKRMTHHIGAGPAAISTPLTKARPLAAARSGAPAGAIGTPRTLPAPKKSSAASDGVPISCHEL